MSSGYFSPLQVRQKRYIEGISKGLTRSEAVRYAGYAPTTQPYKVENSSVKAALAHLIRKAIPAHKLAATLAEGINATETKFFSKDGIVTDSREVVNHSERRQYAQLAATMGYQMEEQSKPDSEGFKLVIETVGLQTKVTAETK